MFSKSKRFPEGSESSNTLISSSFLTELVLLPPPVYFSVGKDYIPGPGEYDVSSDETSRHKRYGFLSQTNRFPEGQHYQGKTKKLNILVYNTSPTHNIVIHRFIGIK
jgi:hypothetical protein